MGSLRNNHTTVWLSLSLALLPPYLPAGCPKNFPESGVLKSHLEQADIVNGRLTFQEIFDKGQALFVTRFNLCDGQGRPATTGTGEKRKPDEPDFIRTSAPDANACVGCHIQPVRGGAGDIVANAFVLAQALDPVTDSVAAQLSNERNTLGMHGAGAIEALAREMTQELQSQAASLGNGSHTLTTKGIDFEITKSDGVVVDSKGINKDLIVRPFHQSGVVVSLREFSVNAMNHHHGMQAEERFDLNPQTNFDRDFDEDGVKRELTIGDITALAVFQAALSIPQQILPKDPAELSAVRQGENHFLAIGCASCHKPAMVLNSTIFSEPNPFNPAGTFNDTSKTFTWDMTQFGVHPRLQKENSGQAIVRAYTDLKRHNLCDDQGTDNGIRFFCNEQLDQGRPSQDGRPGREFFLTRKLWDAGSSAPYGHRGDITTLTEAILYHGGEGRESRDKFASLTRKEQAEIIKFLKSLQVVEFDGDVDG